MKPQHTPTAFFDENQRTALIYAYGEQVERTYRAASERLCGDSIDDSQLDQEAQKVRVQAVGRVTQWLDDQIAAAEQRGAAKALRDAATEWDLPVDRTPRTSGKVREWLLDRADRLEGDDETH